MFSKPTVIPSSRPLPAPQNQAFVDKSLSFFTTHRPIPAHHLEVATACVANDLNDFAKDSEQIFTYVYDRVATSLIRQPLGPYTSLTFKAPLIAFVQGGFARRMAQAESHLDAACDTAAVAHQRQALEILSQLDVLAPEQSSSVRVQFRRFPLCAHQDFPASQTASVPWVLSPSVALYPCIKDSLSYPIFFANRYNGVSRTQFISRLFDQNHAPLGFLSPSIHRGAFAKIKFFYADGLLSVARCTHFFQSAFGQIKTTDFTSYTREQSALDACLSPLRPMLRLYDQKRKIYDIIPLKSGDVHQLRVHLGISKALPTPLLWSVFHGVLHDLTRLHHAGYVHLDIKPENILWDTNGRFSLADFGLTKLRFSQSRDIGTPGFYAPEILEHAGTCIESTCDMFSLGVMLLHLVAPVEATHIPWWKYRLYKADHDASMLKTRNFAKELMYQYRLWLSDRSSAGSLDMDRIKHALSATTVPDPLDQAAVATWRYAAMLPDLIFRDLLHPDAKQRISLDGLRVRLETFSPDTQQHQAILQTLQEAHTHMPMTHQAQFYEAKMRRIAELLKSMPPDPESPQALAAEPQQASRSL